MDIKIKTQPTPNPNALKFITSVTVISRDRKSYDTFEDCMGNPLAQALFRVENVTQIHFFENVITVTQNGQSDWPDLQTKITDLIIEKLPTHDPNFLDLIQESSSSAPPLPPELSEINKILDRTIRPYLQGDGGDLEVLELKDHMLWVRYEGACGSCPSSTLGTLQAIESILREEYNDPELQVHAV